MRAKDVKTGDLLQVFGNTHVVEDHAVLPAQNGNSEYDEVELSLLLASPIEGIFARLALKVRADLDLVELRDQAVTHRQDPTNPRDAAFIVGHPYIFDDDMVRGTAEATLRGALAALPDEDDDLSPY